MTNGIALGLGVVIAVLVGADALLNDWAVAVSIGRGFLGLVEWLAFWR
jgi:hypothetical protein